MGKYYFCIGNPLPVIDFFGSKSVTITKEICDNNGRILVLQVKTDDEIYFASQFCTILTLNRSNSKPYMNLRLSSQNLMLIDINVTLD